MSFLFGNRSNRTFKPKKNINEGTHQYELMKHAAATLGSGDLRLAVMLPEGEDLNEWIAVNIVDFFNQINMLYGTITEFCTEEKCPLMSAGPKYEYHWADGMTVKKPIKCSAPKYIDYLMTWVQDQLDDESIFPSKIGVAFPKNFNSIAKTILKRLFRVYAHIYHQHFSQVVRLDEEAHLNTSFKHFIFFVQEFHLIDKRELAPLSELIEKLVEKKESTKKNASNNVKDGPSSNSENSIHLNRRSEQQVEMPQQNFKVQHNTCHNDADSDRSELKKFSSKSCNHNADNIPIIHQSRLINQTSSQLFYGHQQTKHHQTDQLASSQDYYGIDSNDDLTIHHNEHLHGLPSTNYPCNGLIMRHPLTISNSNLQYYNTSSNKGDCLSSPSSSHTKHELFRNTSNNSPTSYRSHNNR
ncbi:MOB kinase activator 1B [Sarcoptes scabiei]|uniref:MOB kinase activator 1B n=1 Tax=Sarcoptes scabiei TaxID=52283 RepID=A0A834VHB5_SARSC|nr:MOB kinase activator 1B [Sarcoptes scabiei]